MLPFEAYLARTAVCNLSEPVPSEVQALLRDCLVKLLVTTQGKITNYRLMDADLGEVLDSHLPSPIANKSGTVSTLDGARTECGPRWALASGFYNWQLGMAIAIAAEATRDGPVNLLVTLPSAFSFEEVKYKLMVP